MRLVFFCSSLKPGRDGVGDYTHRLATELLKLNHSCLCIEINEHAIDLKDFSASQNTISVSSKKSWREQIQFIQRIISECRPDLLSLQYVPYGYSSKGVPILLPYKLSSIRGDFKWHLMFHELWVEPIGLYRKFISAMQRRTVSSLCRKLTPAVVHTSNPSYSDKLAQAGISASVLPLFSNIDLAQANPQLRSQLIHDCGFRANDDEIWMFVFFGSIHPGWDCRSFLELVSNVARLAKKAGVIFISIGKNQGKGAEIWNSMQSHKNQFLNFLRLGELSAPDVSRHLQAVDFGIATTPLSLLGKSGSAAAMASHGLTTIVQRVDVAVSRETIERRGLVLVDEFFKENLLNPPRPRKFDSVGEIAQLFLKTLDPNFAVR